MLTVTDARTRRLVPLGVSPDRLIRMCVHVPGEPDGLASARLLVVADVLLRTVEAQGFQMIWACELGDPSPARIADLAPVMSALGVHPPMAFTAAGKSGPDGLGRPADVHVSDDVRCDSEQGTWLVVADARRPGHGDGTDDAPDAVAVRLALLDRPYRSSARFLPHDIGTAAYTLHRWRRRVAQWACAPSKPVPDDLRRRAQAAFEADLDTPAVLNLLRRTEIAQEVAAGAKFEMFALADRILGLGLTQDVGQHAFERRTT